MRRLGGVELGSKIAHSLGVALGTLPNHRGDVGLTGLRPEGRGARTPPAGDRARKILSSLAVGIPAQEEGRGELGQLHGKDQNQPMRFVLFWLKVISQQSGAGGSGV